MNTEQTQLSARFRRLLSTRRGIVIVAGAAAVFGGAILMAFLSNYRDSLTGSDGTVKVVVATKLIEKGSPADAVAADNMYELAAVDKADLKKGAIQDPASLKGLVTVDNIYPGEQIVAADFRKQGKSLGDRIRGRERAISLPFTQYGGLIGDVTAGDRVDVIAGFRLEPNQGRDRPVVRTILQNALVLKAPKEGDDSTAGTAAKKQPVVLRATDDAAADLAFSAEYGIVWLTLRPKAGAKSSRPSPRAVDNVLFGLPPIPVERFRQQLGQGGAR